MERKLATMSQNHITTRQFWLETRDVESNPPRPKGNLYTIGLDMNLPKCLEASVDFLTIH